MAETTWTVPQQFVSSAEAQRNEKGHTHKRSSWGDLHVMTELQVLDKVEPGIEALSTE
jgi:hypothetical protein